MIWKPRYATRVMRERAYAQADLDRERAAKAGGPGLISRLHGGGGGIVAMSRMVRWIGDLRRPRSRP